MGSELMTRYDCRLTRTQLARAESVFDSHHRAHEAAKSIEFWR